jgi:hypothetical protein
MSTTKMATGRNFPPRSKFTSDEDILLRDLVSDLGEQDWSAISARMVTRSARQCRDRWVGYLSPRIENAAWTAAEESLLLEKYAELGPRWMLIAPFFPSRTNINLKSRWHLIQRRVRKGVSRLGKRQCFIAGQPSATEPDIQNPEEDAIFEDEFQTELALDPWLTSW